MPAGTVADSDLFTLQRISVLTTTLDKMFELMADREPPGVMDQIVDALTEKLLAAIREL